jgi:hypothetical protein
MQEQRLVSETFCAEIEKYFCDNTDASTWNTSTHK